MMMVVVMFSGCSLYVGEDDTAPPPVDQPLDACAELAAITAPVPNVGEILVYSWFVTPGESEMCVPMSTDDTERVPAFTRTRTVLVRLDTFEVGTYGQIAPGAPCEWRNAVEIRAHATGRCP